MTITDWIIRLSIFGVLAIAVIGTLQNILDAIRQGRKWKEQRPS
jgi:hypothetical protein